MDERTTSADFYPGGKTKISAGGGITSGEGGGGGIGEPMVPITNIYGLPDRYTEGDMKSKIDDICKVLRTGGLALAAILAFPVWGANDITVYGTRKDKLFNDDFVVTNVTVDLESYAKRSWIEGKQYVQSSQVVDIVEGKVSEAIRGISRLTTNDVCSIVTNEVIIEVGSEWQLVASDPTVQKVLDDNKTTIVYESGQTGHKEWMINNPPSVEGFFIAARDSGITDKNAKSVFFGEVYVHNVEYYSVSIVATRTGGNVKRNALGLAKYEDLANLPTHETVTNVARSVVNCVWDASLGVAWEARMYNGHLYYIAVTNKPPEAK